MIDDAINQREAEERRGSNRFIYPSVSSVCDESRARARERQYSECVRLSERERPYGVFIVSGGS